MKLKKSFLWLVVFLLIFSSGALADGKIVKEIVHGVSLEKTVTGESADRSVSVYLPASYDSAAAKRYPVLYLLHGIGDTDETWTRAWNDKNPGFATVQDVLNKGVAEGKFGEMIVVMPDEKTKWFGSFYVNSTVTGNWDDFTTRELIAFIDKKYRTLANAGSRGIAGHSMGGYGALTLSMKHADVFSVVYAMNPAVMDWGGDLTIDNPAFTKVLQAKSYDDLLKTNDVYTIATVTVGQAFSPNPSNPPFFADMPYALSADGKLAPDDKAFARWRENSPIRMVEKYRANLMKLRGLRFDSGYEDEFKFIPVNCRALSAELTNNGVEHVFEEYNGDHRNRMWGRGGRLYTEVFPYFWLLLDH
ncbi:MAG TPA: alpha/beta hydrolase-fold protein [Pyrinomonadaceae bacterium]|jgi:S-formylglutathione hydrolase FrmB